MIILSILLQIYCSNVTMNSKRTIVSSEFSSTIHAFHWFWWWAELNWPLLRTNLFRGTNLLRTFVLVKVDTSTYQRLRFKSILLCSDGWSEGCVLDLKLPGHVEFGTSSQGIVAQVIPPSWNLGAVLICACWLDFWITELWLTLRDCTKTACASRGRPITILCAW